jgi:hypothetical protein
LTTGFSDVCSLRLDFETFTTIGATEAASYTCPDTFKVTVNIGPKHSSLFWFQKIPKTLL